MSLNKPQRLPLWQSVGDELLAMPELAGTSLGTEWFEERLHLKRGTAAFGLSMKDLRAYLEKPENGSYVMRQHDGGSKYTIQNGEGNQRKVKRLSSRVTRTAKRQLQLIRGTLSNAAFELSADERELLSGQEERAAMRIILIARPMTIGRIITKRSPKMIAGL